MEHGQTSELVVSGGGQDRGGGATRENGVWRGWSGGDHMPGSDSTLALAGRVASKTDPPSCAFGFPF